MTDGFGDPIHQLLPLLAALSLAGFTGCNQRKSKGGVTAKNRGPAWS